MAQRFSVEPQKLLETLKGTVFKNATNEQLMALVVVSNEYGLNPFTRQIFAFPDKGGGIVPVVSVDGWLHMMQEHPQFDGIEYEWEREKTGNKPISCTAIIYRKDRSKPTKITEFLSECHRNTDPWNKSPSRMLRHRATIQCIRIAFGFSVADPEDAERMLERDVTPDAKTSAPKFLSKPKPAMPDAQDDEAAPAPSDPAPSSTPEPESGTYAEAVKKHASLSDPSSNPVFSGVKATTEADRVKLYEEINEMRASADISMAEFKKRVAALGLADANAMLNKYPAETLLAVKARWEEIVKGGGEA
jgi:phage recombination protein Bet